MYSDVSITDFDSDEDAAWPVEQVSDNDRDSLIGSDNDGSDVSKLRSYRVYEFGDFEDNHGWIQCQSRSYPDRVYFHNTYSGCNTWYRPVSRYIDIPFVSVERRLNDTDDASPNDLELMSVSDGEKEESNVLLNRDKSCISDVMARCYYTPQVDLTYDIDEPCRPVDVFASECCDRKEQIDGNNNDNSDESEVRLSPHSCAMDFLETELLVGDGDVNTERTIQKKSSLNDNSSTESTSPTRPQYVVYRVPRMKKIGYEDLLVKPTRTYVRETRGPRKIICDMYGVRTINYDLPGPETTQQVRTEVGVKSSKLSESESDTSKPPSPSSRRAKTSPLFGSEWHDIEKNLHQPLLSDSSSSSSSSRSDTNDSSANPSNSSTTCSCSCSTCSSRSSRS